MPAPPRPICHESYALNDAQPIASKQLTKKNLVGNIQDKSARRFAEISTHTHTSLTTLFWDYSGEPVPEM